MQPLTIITTYYNDKEYLEQFINGFYELKKKYPILKLIVVDDGSKVYPAKDILKKHEDVELYTILQDVGFNSHGARNLGMDRSTTYWNLLIDVDYELTDYYIEKFTGVDLNNNTSYQFSVNTMIINKDVFMSCRGYDEEFFNIHHGDRIFIDYISKRFKAVYFRDYPVAKRLARKVLYCDDVSITTYSDHSLICPSDTGKKFKKIEKQVMKRYQDEDFDSKPILNFKWEKTF